MQGFVKLKPNTWMVEWLNGWLLFASDPNHSLHSNVSGMFWTTIYKYEEVKIIFGFNI